MDGCYHGQADFQLQSCRADQTRSAVGHCAAPFVISALNPVVSAGTLQPFRLQTPSNAPKLAALKASIAWDGGTFGDEIDLDPTKTDFSVAIRGNPAALTAQIRLTVVPTMGDAAVITSDPFMVLSHVKKIAGSLSALGGAVGSPTGVRFQTPTHIVGDGTYLYISDNTTQQIYRTDLADGTTIVLAGQYRITGSTDEVGSGASFNGPTGLAIVNKTLYVIDSGNDTLRSINIDPSSSAFATVQTVAGQVGVLGSTDAVGTAASFKSLRSIASDGTYIYLGDKSVFSLRKFDPNTAIVSTVAGSATSSGAVDSNNPLSARFGWLTGMTYDSKSGQLYLNDNGFIRTFNIATTVVATVMNTGHKGGTGVINGDAATSRSHYLGDSASDGAYIYFAEYYNHCIRKLNIATNVTSTLAGNCTPAGYADGDPTTAQFYHPYGVTYNSGALYVADSLNAAIRKVDTQTGTVSTYLGGINASGVIATQDGYNAGEATYDQITGLATTDGQTFYVSSIFEQTVRKIDLVAGNVTLVAGQASVPGYANGIGNLAQFSSPSGMWQIGSTLYFGERDNTVVRSINLSTNDAETVAGMQGLSGYVNNSTGASAKFSRIGNIVSDSANLYVADSTNNVIRSVGIGGGWPVSTLVGAAAPAVSSGYQDGSTTSVRFKSPAWITISPDNKTLYVADQGNFVIRSIDIASQTTSTLAGIAGQSAIVDGAPGTGTFGSPSIVACTSSAVYVVDGSLIRKVDLASNSISTLAGGGSQIAIRDFASVGTNAPLSGILSLAVFGNNLYLGTQNAGLGKLDLATNLVSTVAGVTSIRNNNKSYTGESDGPIKSVFDRYDGGMTTDGNHVFLLDGENGVIRQFELDGSGGTVLAGVVGNGGGITDSSASSASFSPYGGMLATDKTYLYVTDAINNSIRRVAIADGTTTTLAGKAGSLGATDGVGTSALFQMPRGIAIDSNNNLYVSDFLAHTIRKISLNTADYGKTTTVAGSAGIPGASDGNGAAATFNNPAGLAILGSMLYIADNGNHTIRRLDLNTNSVTTLCGRATMPGAGNGSCSSALLFSPYAITTDGTNLMVADTGDGLIRLIRMVDETISTLAGLSGTNRDDIDGPIASSALMHRNLLFVPDVGLYLSNPSNLKLVH